MFAGAVFAELAAALFEIDSRCSRHIIKKVALAIPRERWPHRCAVARVKEVVRPGEVLCSGKGRRGVTKVGRVIVKKLAAELARRAASKSNPHCRDGLHGRCFDADES